MPTSTVKVLTLDDKVVVTFRTRKQYVKMTIFMGKDADITITHRDEPIYFGQEGDVEPFKFSEKSTIIPTLEMTDNNFRPLDKGEMSGNTIRELNLLLGDIVLNIDTMNKCQIGTFVSVICNRKHIAKIDV